MPIRRITTTGAGSARPGRSDGRVVSALIHHEYQANEHPGRCRFPAYMECWFNSVLEVQSVDGGVDFARPGAVRGLGALPAGRRPGPPPRLLQPVEHRVGRALHLSSWPRRPGGAVPRPSPGWRRRPARTRRPASACSARRRPPTRAPGAPGTATASRSPMRIPTRASPHPAPCAVIAPFPAPVGSIVRVEPGGSGSRPFRPRRMPGVFPVPGFYTATSRDLLHWSAPRLLLAGPTLYDDACRAGGPLIAYPVILDPASPSRNFDRSGRHPTSTTTCCRPRAATSPGGAASLRRHVDDPGDP